MTKKHLVDLRLYTVIHSINGRMVFLMVFWSTVDVSVSYSAIISVWKKLLCIWFYKCTSTNGHSLQNKTITLVKSLQLVQNKQLLKCCQWHRYTQSIVIPS